MSSPTNAPKIYCSNPEKAYLAIVITVLPLWAILTTLIVFVLLAFHRNLRATKIYDNCTKQSAQYIYHIELRTGDTSSTFNKRRTTLTIDMFDDSQTTLARIAIPGHVIFGRKDAPIGTIEDDKFFELRVTRLWLYRSTKLKKVTTIRLTHSCLESDARIMVYGVEIRTNESDKYKMFFPIMNYITAYGCATKPCFDLEPGGSIDAMGHISSDSSSISEQLSLVDYTLLVHLLSALIFFTSTYEILDGSFSQPPAAAYKGGLVGVACFTAIFLYGLVIRYLFKRKYSQTIGTGGWAFTYYANATVILIVATGIWIGTTIVSYRTICPSMYSFWLVTISVALVCSVSLIVVCSILGWTIQMVSPKQLEQYILPDEVSPHQYQMGFKSKPHHSNSKQQTGASSGGQQQQQQQQQQQAVHSPQSWQMSAPHGGPPVQMHYVVPHGAYASPPPVPGNMYNTPIIYNSMVGPPPGAAAAYKGYPQNAYPSLEAGQYYANMTAVGHAPSPPPPAAAAIPAQGQPQQSPPAAAPQAGGGGGGGGPNYQQQTGFKQFKKIGSNESTGSNYYQQLMKTKGGVKSISQYGELLKQKKPAKKL